MCRLPGIGITGESDGELSMRAVHESTANGQVCRSSSKVLASYLDSLGLIPAHSQAISPQPYLDRITEGSGLHHLYPDSRDDPHLHQALRHAAGTRNRYDPSTGANWKFVKFDNVSLSDRAIHSIHQQKPSYRN